MTWEFVDADTVIRQVKAEVLRVADEERIRWVFVPGRGWVWRYEDDERDLFDGSDVTEEVEDLIADGLLVRTMGSVRITDAGRAALRDAP